MFKGVFKLMFQSSLIMMEQQFIDNLKKLQNDLFNFIPMVDFFGDEEEYIFTFDGEQAMKWEIEKFGKSEGSIYEWTDTEIIELINTTIENNSCSKEDKIFLDHLITFL